MITESLASEKDEKENQTLVDKMKSLFVKKEEAENHIDIDVNCEDT